MEEFVQKILKFAVLYVFFMIFWSIFDFESTIITILLVILASLEGKK
jgi:multidrug efflux pump subunit AcrB|tara:strand:+ start:131 stop:271 length:141 start_codon:yes stop_codon:yes gene_type:complete